LRNKIIIFIFLEPRIKKRSISIRIQRDLKPVRTNSLRKQPVDN